MKALIVYYFEVTRMKNVPMKNYLEFYIFQVTIDNGAAQ